MQESLPLLSADSLLFLIWRYPSGFLFHFNKNTYIDGQNVSFHSVQSVKQTIDTYKDTYSLTVEGRENQSFVIKPEDIGLTITAVVNEDSLKKKQHGLFCGFYI